MDIATSNPQTDPRRPIGEPARALQRTFPRSGRDVLTAAQTLFRAAAGADGRHWFVWSPIAFSAGVVWYFSLHVEPPAWPALLIALGAVAMAALAGRFRRIWIAVLLSALGFASSDFRTSVFDNGILEREISPRLMTGVVVSVENGQGVQRLIFEPLTIARMPADALPDRLRLSWRGVPSDIAAGDRVRFRASASPTPGPVAPGAFDYQRYLYFKGIDGVGFVVSPPSVIPNEQPQQQNWRRRLERTRTMLAARIVNAAPGDGGAVVAAVVTGKRNAIGADVRDALRDAGLAHLLAISGLHMGLAAGLIFFAVRACLASFEIIALRFPIKKWSACAALLASGAYLILSGAGWSAQRAFIMTAIVLIAILFDRRALSLRNVAIAALAILLCRPEAALQPGFQMSFAAVTALIAFYEWWNSRPRAERNYTSWAKLKRYVLGLAATDTIAAGATAPFALYHFNRAAIYSLPANLAAMPLMGFWIMPAAVIGLILTPLGLDAWAWRLSALGVELVIAVAKTVSSQPGAVGLVAQWPPGALIVFSLGFFTLCLIRGPWRFAGLLTVPIGMSLIASTPTADLLLTREGDNVAIVRPRGIAVFDRRKSRFAVRQWREMLAIDERAGKTLSLRDIAQCDALGCVYRGDGDRDPIAVSARPSGLHDDCQRAGLVIALYPTTQDQRRSCSAALLDRRAAWRNGSYAVYLKGARPHYRSARDQRGVRPWTTY